MPALPLPPAPPTSSPPRHRVAGLATGHPWQLGIGLVVWSVWFVVVYGGLSVGCTVAAPAPESRQFNAINGSLLLFTLALVLWLAHASRTCARATRRPARSDAGPVRTRADASGAATPAGMASPNAAPDAATTRFIAHAAAWLYAIAAAAAVFVGAPMLALWPCI